MAGGVQMGTPNFSDAIPPTPPQQGDAGPNHYVDEHTFESGSIPSNTGAIESNWSGLIDQGLRGYHTAGIGGTYNPGQGKSPGNPGVERSAAS